MKKIIKKKVIFLSCRRIKMVLAAESQGSLKYSKYSVVRIPVDPRNKISENPKGINQPS